MENPSLSIIILTHNEEKHLERCIQGLHKITKDIFIVDAFSNDKTISIAKEYNCKIYQNKCPGVHSIAINWALDNCDITTKWVMRIDADEVLDADLIDEIRIELSQNDNPDLKGYFLKRGHIFLGKKMLHGGNFPVKILRIWRNGYAICDDKLMDEKIILSGNSKTKVLRGTFWDHNLNSISWWIEKHNLYATKEAIMQLKNKYSKTELNHHDDNRTILKYLFYERFPKSIRAFLYFIYRYFFKLGFLDGYQGLAWNFLQGFWYRFLVDVKVYEIEKIAENNKITVNEVIKSEYGIDV